MFVSSRKIAAKRIDTQKSPGLKNTTSTRFNETKHGLLALGVTELDEAEGYRATLSDLMQEWNPVGTVEIFLVEAMALDMIRWRRSRRLEAEYITGVLNPPLYENDPAADLTRSFQGRVLDPGLPAPISAGCVQNLVSTFQRYETFFANRLFRTLHELERIQRMRKGERVPPPILLDVSGSVEIGPLGPVPVAPDVLPSDSESAPSPVTLDCIPAETEPPTQISAAQEQAKVLRSDDEILPKPVTEDVTHADTEVADLAPTKLGPEKVLVADGGSLAVAAGGEIVNDKAGAMDSVTSELEQEKVLPNDGVSLPRPVTEDDLHDDAGVVDSAPAELGQKEVMPVAASAVVSDGASGEKTAPAPWRPRVRLGPIWNDR